MKKNDLSNKTVEQLLTRYTEIGVSQDEAIFYDENARYNRLFRERDAIEMELKRRPGDQRRALLALYAHANIQVRLNAAKDTLAVAPEAARELLERIAASHKEQSFEARSTLGNLDSGFFKPT